MINLSFFVRVDRREDDEDFASIKSWSGKTFFKNKFWDLDLVENDNLVMLGISVNRKCDHAGIGIEIGAFFRSFIFHFYDSRHWDHENGCWVEHQETSKFMVDNRQSEE